MEPLTDFGVGVAGEVATSLLAKIKKHVAYLYKFKQNLGELEEANRQLDAKRSDAIKFSGQTSLSVRDVGNTVQLWQSDAEKLDQKAEKLISMNNISCLNLWSRYSSSKDAWELTQSINEKVKSAPDFGMSFDRSVAEGAKFNLRGYMKFESRLKILNGVLDALRRDDVSMCSICGMGGIGKTTLAKLLVKKAEADRLFDKVVMVTVSQNPNFEEIQKGIIDSLELKIESSTMQGRANKLNDWLSNHKTLLILDDVWWQIQDDDFEKVGIPVASNRCKIVVTSRKIDECEKMGSEPNFPLNVLDDGEALELFIQNAGKCVEGRNLKDKARQIVDECRGLPIAIVTIGKALKDAPQGEWDDSLSKLQKSNLSGISDMEKVYSKIQVSYDLLKDPEAQSCLRLCCLFPEDYDVPVEKLVFYGKGLELFKGVKSLKEARDRVDSIVHKLKSSFLLLDSEKREFVKLHDIVRDFTIWISSKDDNPYLVIREKEMERWPENCQYEKCSAISFVSKKITNHPVGLRCPNLKLLHLDYCHDMLPRSFFEGMEELGVVDLAAYESPALTMTKALKTLLITHYSWVNCSDYLREMLGKGNMKNLEIFSLAWIAVSEFPTEIGFLHNLRCLRFYEVIFENIPPGVLLNLVQLEELELPWNFRDWGLIKNGRSNASLDEIKDLPLTSIAIGMQKGSILAENTVKGITRFRIHIGSFNIEEFDLYSNVLVIREVDACDALVNWTGSLLGKCHKLELKRVDLKYIMSQQLGENNCYQCAHFSQLKILKIEDMNCLEEILHGTYFSSIHRPCFTNLTKIYIDGCPKLKRAFSLSVAREFTQLESIELFNCQQIEEVFYDDQVDGGNQNMGESIEKVNDVVVLPRLRKFDLFRIPKLRVVCDGKHAIAYPSLDQWSFHDCGVEDLSYGQFNKLYLGRGVVGGLKNIFERLPFTQDNGIQQIKGLTIAKCRELKYLADAIAGPNLLRFFFSNLEELRIDTVDSIEEIWHGPCLSKIHAQCFSNLTVIWIYKCPKMKHLFPLPVATELRQLQVMGIESCKEMEEIVDKDQVDDGNQVTSSVRLNDPTIENTPPTLNKDEKSSVLCPTPNSLIQCLLPKGKQSKRLLSHEIIEEDVGKGDEREAGHAIVWPRLERLDLGVMPKLRVMYDGDHAIECPSLEELSIYFCDNMESLSYGSFIAPKIKKLTLTRVTHSKSIPELLHFKQDSGIPQLQKLRVNYCPGMIYLVDAMIDRNLLKTFVSNLQELEIRHMDALEEIWHVPYLSTVQPQPCFSHLTKITIEHCPKLKHMFPLSVAAKLTQLQFLLIEGCVEMEEIFYKDHRNQIAASAELNIPPTESASIPPYSTHQETMEKNAAKLDEKEVDDATTDATMFPQLGVISLRDLTKLRVFYDGNHAIELPSLNTLTITGCNKIESLSNGSFKAPKLASIEINQKGYPSGEDLNTIVKMTLNIDKQENEDRRKQKEGEDNKDAN